MRCGQWGHQGLTPECRVQWTGDPSEVVVPPRCPGSPVVELPQRAATKPTCILHVLYVGVPESWDRTVPNIPMMPSCWGW